MIQSKKVDCDKRDIGIYVGHEIGANEERLAKVYIPLKSFSSAIVLMYCRNKKLKAYSAAHIWQAGVVS